MYEHPPRRLILPIAPAVAGTIGLLAAAGIGLLPNAKIEGFVAATGLSPFLSPVSPPLVRAILVVVGGALIAALAGAGLYAALGRRAVSIGRPAEPPHEVAEKPVPVLRRADAHPDAPARRPVSAAKDLGTPLLEVSVGMAMPGQEPELDLPADLDQPLAAFDPAAILPVPRSPVRPVAALARLPRPQLIDPGDRFETFAPARLSTTDLATRAEPTATIHALLDRLERGFSRSERTPPPPVRSGDGLQDALGTLRKLAAGGSAGMR